MSFNFPFSNLQTKYSFATLVCGFRIKPRTKYSFDHNFFETIDTEEKYLYWADKIDINKDDEDIIEMLNNNDPNFGKIWKAMEAFLFMTHRIDLHHWDK